MNENQIEEKSFDFAARIVNLCRFLQESQKEYVLSKQLLRSGTSIGANVAEAQHAQSRADFLAKMKIASKEASETQYWLKLLYKTEYLNETQYKSIRSDIDEIVSILVSICKTIQTNDQKHRK
mgnify:CR=1 FL=1